MPGPFSSMTRSVMSLHVVTPDGVSCRYVLSVRVLPTRQDDCFVFGLTATCVNAMLRISVAGAASENLFRVGRQVLSVCLMGECPRRQATCSARRSRVALLLSKEVGHGSSGYPRPLVFSSQPGIPQRTSCPHSLGCNHVMCGSSWYWRAGISRVAPDH
jgi:hypothetical protein